MAETQDPSQQLEPASTADAVAASDGAPSADALRDDIAATRARISQTLDRIEDRLVRRKEEIRSKATLQGVRERLSREPWRSMAIAFAAGYIVAALRD